MSRVAAFSYMQVLVDAVSEHCCTIGLSTHQDRGVTYAKSQMYSPEIQPTAAWRKNSACN